MAKKQVVGLLGCLLALGFLASCGGANTSSFVNPMVETRFADRYTFKQLPGTDGIKASISSPDTLSYDDQIEITTYLYQDEANITGFYENGAVTMEDAIRKDIETVYGQGYPIVALDDNCFGTRDEITSLRLSTNLTSIGKEAINGLTKLTALNAEELTKLTYLGDDAFSSTPWFSTYVAGHSGPIIFGHVLCGYGGNVSGTYEVPEGITQISSGAFKGQKNLTGVKLPSSLKTISSYAFAESGLKEVTVPSSVTTLGDHAFEKCSSLTKVDLGKAKNGSLVLGDDDALLQVSYAGDVSLFELTNGSASLANITALKLTGEKIVDYAASSLTALTSLDLTGVKYIGSSALSGLTSLTTITGDEGVEFLANNSLKDSAWFSAQPDGGVYLGKCFLGFKGAGVDNALVEGTLGVSASAFMNSTNTFNLPTSIKYVGKNAFKGVASLAAVNLPSVAEIGSSAFADCTNLKTIVLADNCTLAKGVFLSDTALTSIKAPYSDDLTAMYGDLSATLEEYSILAGPTEIPNSVFSNYKKLKKIEFGTTIETVGVGAFQGCIALTEVDFPSNVSDLNAWAFAGCTSLTKVKFHTEIDTTNTDRVAYKGIKLLGTFLFYQDAAFVGSSINDEEFVEGRFVVPESIINIKGCILAGSKVTSLIVRMPDYYLAGTVVMTDIRDDQKYITLSADWNSDPFRPADSYGNPFKIPYTIEKIKTK